MRPPPPRMRGAPPRGGLRPPAPPGLRQYPRVHRRPTTVYVVHFLGMVYVII